MNLVADGVRPPSCLNAHLDHLALSTGDPAALANFYRTALGFLPPGRRMAG